MDTVQQVDIASVRLPLRKPVQLGAATLVHRDYVVMRLVLSNGAEGFAFGYDRGLPLLELCVHAAQNYLGQSSDQRNLSFKQGIGAVPAPRAAMTRGASLCDIALWDAWCVSHGLPLWAALGGVRDSVPVMPIIGYGATADEAASDAADLASQGYGIIKCMIDGRDLAADKAMIEAVAGALPPGVSVGMDAHWSWSSVAEALPWCRTAERFGLAFVEDPFAPTQTRAVAELAGRVEVPLALGEDVVDLHGFLALAQAGGMVRIDASVSGGITRAIEAIALARAFDRPVIPHVFLNLHSQLAFAFESLLCVEMMSPRISADPITDFFLTQPVIARGSVMATDIAGAGQVLDWQALTPHFMRTERVER